ncbi:MAG: DUF615 domain-containing protein [Gammaproteobacteria bacterium]|nr:DUF615 domain-containing protein [Gammaproteobacteria bacterium]
MSTDGGSPAPDGGLGISKSARKRDAREARRLGEALTELDPARLARIPIGEALSDALEAYRGLSQREARRRQLQRIGRLMRDEDRDAIAVGLARVTELTPEERGRNRRLERWRERLLTEPDALTEYVRLHPGTDVQPLRHLIGRTRRARDPAVRADFARRLFRLLREREDRADG